MNQASFDNNMSSVLTKSNLTSGWRILQEMSLARVLEFPADGLFNCFVVQRYGVAWVDRSQHGQNSKDGIKPCLP